MRECDECESYPIIRISHSKRLLSSTRPGFDGVLGELCELSPKEKGVGR